MTLILPLIVLLLSACASTPYPVPVAERQIGHDGGRFHVVQHGDTLYGIARRYGLDPYQLTQMNGITDPGQLKIGQEILLSASGHQETSGGASTENEPRIFAITSPDDQAFSTVAPAATYAPSATLKTEPKGTMLPYSEAAKEKLGVSSQTGQPYEKVAISSPGIIDNSGARKPAGSKKAGGIDWVWPTDGRVQDHFSEKSRGVGIAGGVNQPVHASASGTVVYSGSGLRGYGNLVIIKHDDTYLSAYGHNSKVLVQEGERVTRGQKIAEMGRTDNGSTKLHFEIRKQGQPVNPMEFLPAH